jgi:arylsulfatase A-like enzyme
MTIKKEKPNILFVFSDQHRWCDLNCYGNQAIYSPHFDAFAQKGVQFTNCISNSPLCVPARGTILTGLHALKHGAMANDLPINLELESIAHVLTEQGGYHTGYIGKWHLAGVPRNQYIQEGNGRLGFKDWKVANCTHRYMGSYYDDENNERHTIEGYEPIKQTDLAIDFIQRRQQAPSPWALFLSWGPPHDPYLEVPDKYLQMYEEKQLDVRDNVGERAMANLSTYVNRERIESSYKGYYAHISALDEQFGRLISALEGSGQLDNTVIIYTSDHGDMLGSQGYLNKQLPWDESVKVPLMIYWKDRTIRGIRDDLMSLVDLPVSLLGLVGLQFTNQVDGQDLHQLFTSNEGEGVDSCYMYDLSACHQASGRDIAEWRGIRTKQYTYARTIEHGEWLLYDNEADPYQLNNLIQDRRYEAIKQKLSAMLSHHISSHDALKSWKEICQEHDLVDAWNRSQAYFNRPLMQGGKST